MRKNIFVLMTTVFMCLCSIFYMSILYTMITYASEKSYIVDEIGILAESEASNLQSLLDEISERYACDVAIVIAESLNGMSTQDFADDYYEYNDLGMGYDHDGILFLVSMNEREWAFSTYGFGINAFTDAVMDSMEEKIIPYLSDGDYYGAFLTYADEADAVLSYVRTLETSENISDGEYPYYEKVKGEDAVFRKVLMILGLVPISIGIGTVLAYMQKKRAVKQYSGVIDNQRAMTKSYVSNMQLIQDQTLPMGRGVHRIHSPRKKQNNGGGVHQGHIGSSTVHQSTAGRIHGGKSGKF